MIKILMYKKQRIKLSKKFKIFIKILYELSLLEYLIVLIKKTSTVLSVIIEIDHYDIQKLFISRLDDDDSLTFVVLNCNNIDIGCIALQEIKDNKCLIKILKTSNKWRIQKMAIDNIYKEDSLADIIINAKNYWPNVNVETIVEYAIQKIRNSKVLIKILKISNKWRIQKMAIDNIFNADSLADIIINAKNYWPNVNIEPIVEYTISKMVKMKMKMSEKQEIYLTMLYINSDVIRKIFKLLKSPKALEFIAINTEDSHLAIGAVNNLSTLNCDSRKSFKNICNQCKNNNVATCSQAILEYKDVEFALSTMYDLICCSESHIKVVNYVDKYIDNMKLAPYLISLLYDMFIRDFKLARMAFLELVKRNKFYKKICVDQPKGMVFKMIKDGELNIRDYINLNNNILVNGYRTRSECFQKEINNLCKSIKGKYYCYCSSSQNQLIHVLEEIIFNKILFKEKTLKYCITGDYYGPVWAPIIELSSSIDLFERISNRNNNLLISYGAMDIYMIIVCYYYSRAWKYNENTMQYLFVPGIPFTTQEIEKLYKLKNNLQDLYRENIMMAMNTFEKYAIHGWGTKYIGQPGKLIYNAILSTELTLGNLLKVCDVIEKMPRDFQDDEIIGCYSLCCLLLEDKEQYKIK